MICVIVASSDLYAQFSRGASIRPYDLKNIEIASSFALVGTDQYMSIGASIPVTSLISVGTKAYFRANHDRVTSWSEYFQRTYGSMYYAYVRAEGSIMLTWDMDLRLSATGGLGAVNYRNDIPCFERSAIEPVMMINPDVNILYKMSHNFHASLSFATLYSPTFEAMHIRQVPKPLLGFNIRMYPWKVL